MNAVILKDVISRNNIRNVSFLEKLTDFIADNIGKIISASSISKFMKSQGTSVSPDTVIDYAQYLEDAYIIHKVNRSDIHGKRLFESNDKLKISSTNILSVWVIRLMSVNYKPVK